MSAFSSSQIQVGHRPHRHDCSDFAIEIDPFRRYVELTLRGFWSVETCAGFDRRLRQMLPLLPLGGCAIGTQVTLFDLTDFPVQQQDSLTALGAMAADSSIGSRRIAIITHSQLVKRQAHRVAPTYGVFKDRASALGWLMEDDSAA